MSFAVFVLLNAVWMIAGFLTGITSFGGNILAIPLMTLFMGAKDAIVFGCVAGTAIFMGLGLIYRRHTPWRETLFLGLCGLSGVPVGVWILSVSPPRLILLLAGIFIALFSSGRYLPAYSSKTIVLFPDFAASPLAFFPA